MKNLTYKQKNHLLWLTIAVVLLLAYNMSISPTIEAWQTNGDLKVRQETAGNAPVLLAQLSARLQQLDKLAGGENFNDPQEKLLQVVTAYCDSTGTILRTFPRAMESEEGDYKVQTGKVVVQGDFIQLLRLVNHLEMNFKQGRVASVTYSTEKERKTRTTVLTASIYIQSIKNES